MMSMVGVRSRACAGDRARAGRPAASAPSSSEEAKSGAGPTSSGAPLQLSRRAGIAKLLAVGLGLPAAGALARPPPASAKAANYRLDVLVKSLEEAGAELRDMEQAVEYKSKLGVEMPYKDLRQKLRSGALGELRGVALTVDDYIGEAPLTPLDEEVWRTMAPNRSGKSVKVPFGPNAVVCAVLSCVDDPRENPSTDLLLTQKMLDEGLLLGMAGNTKVTGATILTNIQDLQAKLAMYIDVVQTRT